MTEFEGSIWVAQNNDEITFICIKKRSKDKIQALGEKNREVRVSEDKLLWQHPNRIRTPEEWPNRLSTLQATVEALGQDIDVSLLWASARELQVSEMDDLADLYFGGEITTEYLAAIWQTLAKERLHFKRRGKAWEARTAEQVAELKTQRRREQAQAQQQAAAEAWLKQIAKSLPTSFQREEVSLLEVPTELGPFVERLEAWLLRGDLDKLVEELVTVKASEMNLNPRELVFDILQKVGRLPADAKREVMVAGLRPDFPPAILEAAQKIQVWQPSSQQEVIELLFSIDDEETREVDDALGIERVGDHFKITIAIADPASIIHRGDLLDREAMRRGTTVYLPTQTVLMLPERVSCDLASLTAHQIRPSIVLRTELDDQGHLLQSSISREAIRVCQRLNYSEADELLANGHQKLQDLLECTRHLQKQRLAAGAFNLQRPEYKVNVNQSEIKITLIDKDSPSRILVAEMMILANYISANYAQSHQIPIIYRTQEPPLEPIPEAILADPLGFYKIRKLLRASTLSSHPSNHQGLGLPVYTQLTSPLRRFADLVMQRQLVAHLLGEPLPYDPEELAKVSATAERTAREARMVESESKKRWFMQYLKQSWGDQPLDALIIESAGKTGYRVEMQPWGVDAFLATSKGLIPGEIVRAVVDKIRVKEGMARLKLI